MYAGIDTHKDTLAVAVIDAAGRLLASCQEPNTEQGFARLAELFGVRPEDREAATVAGLVSELLGRIPAPGEVVEDDSLRFEVLEASSRRVERLRISRKRPGPAKAASA